VERAARDGALTCASLMISERAAADAVARARSLPDLGVGLHVVVADAKPMTPPEQIPDLVDSSGALRKDLFAASVAIFARPSVRRQLAREIEAQFAAFAATGLTLDHVNVHKHLHMHPTTAGLIFAIGRRYGMRALRVPREPTAEGIPARLMRWWAGKLAARARRDGLFVNDHLLGLAATGQMTEERTLALIADLRPGVTELYFHPATSRPPELAGPMPEYRHMDELAALLSPALKERLAAMSVPRIRFGDLA
jgi:hopanoid biosynthesis associated protein HpnK